MFEGDNWRPVNPVIRRIVLWQWNEAATPERRIGAKEGLAYIRYGGHVDMLDFGEDLDSGLGPGRRYDLALLRDHVDRAFMDVFVDDPHHFRVGNYIDEITHMESTARVDYLYAGPPATRGAIRHIALYGWREGSAKPTKHGSATSSPASEPRVRSSARSTSAMISGWAKATPTGLSRRSSRTWTRSGGSSTDPRTCASPPRSSL